MAKHSVAMFVQKDGERVQVGWASPKDESGIRTFEYSPGFENIKPRDVSFEDDERSQIVAEETEDAREEGVAEEPVVEHDDSYSDNYPQAGDEGKDSQPLQVETNEVVDETVELSNGGTITDLPDEETQLLSEDEIEEGDTSAKLRRDLRAENEDINNG